MLEKPLTNPPRTRAFTGPLPQPAGSRRQRSGKKQTKVTDGLTTAERLSQTPG